MVKARSKPAYINYNEIQPLIDANKLDAYDYIYCIDKEALYIISPDLQIKPVRNKYEVYPDLATALIAVNNSDETYLGEMVMIDTEEDGIKPYIVNLNTEDNTYKLLPVLSGHYEAIVSYDTIEDVPIQNINAQTEINIYDLPDGNYAVMGNYKIHEADPTHRMSSRKTMYFIETDAVDPTKKYITEIAGSRIKFYICDAVNFAENKYLLSSEIGTEVQDYLDANFGTYMDTYVSTHTADDSDVHGLFD